MTAKRIVYLREGERPYEPPHCAWCPSSDRLARRIWVGEVVSLCHSCRNPSGVGYAAPVLAEQNAAFGEGDAVEYRRAGDAKCLVADACLFGVKGGICRNCSDRGGA